MSYVYDRPRRGFSGFGLTIGLAPARTVVVTTPQTTIATTAPAAPRSTITDAAVRVSAPEAPGGSGPAADRSTITDPTRVSAPGATGTRLTVPLTTGPVPTTTQIFRPITTPAEFCKAKGGTLVNGVCEPNATPQDFQERYIADQLPQADQPTADRAAYMQSNCAAAGNIWRDGKCITEAELNKRASDAYCASQGMIYDGISACVSKGNTGSGDQAVFDEAERASCLAQGGMWSNNMCVPSTQIKVPSTGSALKIAAIGGAALLALKFLR